MPPKAFEVAPAIDPRLAPLSPEQARRLVMDDLPPVVFQDLSQWQGGDYAGYCPRHPNMPNMGGGEVVIDRPLAMGETSEKARATRLAGIYVHELAHRLVPGECHGPVFAAVCAAMTARTIEGADSLRARLRWYDVQDAENPGEALNHAIEFSHAHGRSEVPAKELPDLARASWTAWRAGAWACFEASRKRDAAVADLLNKAKLAAAEEALAAERARSARLSKQVAKARADAERDKGCDWGNFWLACLACAMLGALLAVGLRI